METTQKTLLVQGKRIPVSDEIYKAYYQHREHARYQHKRAMQHEASIQRLEESGVNLETHLANPTPPIDHTTLYQALAQLDPQTQEIVWALALEETTERALAQKLGLSKTTLHRKKQKALAQLRTYLETHPQE